MAKRIADERDSQRVEVKLVTVADIGSGIEPGTPQQPKTVRLRLLKDVILKTVGPVTGKVYVFNRGGSEMDVDEKDATIMIERRSGGCDTCPSNSGSQPYFEIVEV